MYNPRWWRVYRNDNIFRMDWVIHGHMGNVLVNHVSYYGSYMGHFWVSHTIGYTVPVCYPQGPIPRARYPHG